MFEDFNAAASLTNAMATNPLITGVLGSAISATIASYGTYLWTKSRLKKLYAKAVNREELTGSLHISTLVWTETDKNGYELVSQGETKDLKDILPQDYKETLPKYILAAATINQDTDHLSLLSTFPEAVKAEQFSVLFSSEEDRDSFAQDAQQDLVDKIRKIAKKHICGDGLIREALENQGPSKKYYAALVHENGHNTNTLRLMIIPEAYLQDGALPPLTANFENTTEAEQNELALLHAAVEELKNNDGLCEMSRVKAIHGSTRQRAQSQINQSGLTADHPAAASP